MYTVTRYMYTVTLWCTNRKIQIYLICLHFHKCIYLFGKFYDLVPKSHIHNSQELKDQELVSNIEWWEESSILNLERENYKILKNYNSFDLVMLLMIIKKKKNLVEHLSDSLKLSKFIMILQVHNFLTIKSIVDIFPYHQKI